MIHLLNCVQLAHDQSLSAPYDPLQRGLGDRPCKVAIIALLRQINQVHGVGRRLTAGSGFRQAQADRDKPVTTSISSRRTGLRESFSTPARSAYVHRAYGRQPTFRLCGRFQRFDDGRRLGMLVCHSPAAGELSMR